MIFAELSNAVFRFCLRCIEAELDGGVFKHPPPVDGGKSRGPVGRGLSSPTKSTEYRYSKRRLWRPRLQGPVAYNGQVGTVHNFLYYLRPYIGLKL